MVFNHDADSMPRVWTGKEDIKTITKEARSVVTCSKFLDESFVLRTFCLKTIECVLFKIAVSEAFICYGCHSVG